MNKHQTVSRTGTQPSGKADKPQRTTEEQEFLKDMTRMQGRPLTVQEENLSIEQARQLGELD